MKSFPDYKIIMKTVNEFLIIPESRPKLYDQPTNVLECASAISTTTRLSGKNRDFVKHAIAVAYAKRRYALVHDGI